MLPPDPALYVSVYWLSAKVAVTVRSAVTGPSVRVAVATSSLHFTKW
jgi:hypothetical protein